MVERVAMLEIWRIRRAWIADSCIDGMRWADLVVGGGFEKIDCGRARVALPKREWRKKISADVKARCMAVRLRPYGKK